MPICAHYGKVTSLACRLKGAIVRQTLSPWMGCSTSICQRTGRALGQSLRMVLVGIRTECAHTVFLGVRYQPEKSRARQSDLPCPFERRWLQRIKECEQLLLLWFSELSEAPGYVLGLASVPLYGIFER